MSRPSLRVPVGAPRRTGRRLSLVASVLLAGAAALGVTAAGAATLPPSQPDIGTAVADGPVYAVAHAPQGSTYIGGDFDHVGPRSGSGVALTQSGGTLAPSWPGLGTPNFPEVAGGMVKAVVSDGNGGWYIGGDFTHVDGQAQARLAHIRPDGELDTSWTPKPNGTVRALAIGKANVPPAPLQAPQSKWTLFVGGTFTSVGSDNRANLAAFDLNPGAGTPKSSSVVAGWNPDPDNTVHALAAVTIPNIQRDAAAGGGTFDQTIVLVGGDYKQLAITSGDDPDLLNGVWGPGSIRKNGAAIDATDIAFGVPFSGGAVSVRALAAGPPVQGTTTATDNNDKTVYFPIYAGGDFTSPKTNIAAFQLKVTNKTVTSPNGLSPALANFGDWAPFASAIGAVKALALSGNGQTVYLGGKFSGNVGQSPVRRESLAAVAGIPSTPSVIGATGCGGFGTECPATPDAWSPVPGGPVWEDPGPLSATNDDVVRCVQTGKQAPCNSVNSIAVTGSGVYVGGDFSTIGFQSPIPAKCPGTGPSNVPTCTLPSANQSQRNAVAALSPVGGSSVLGWDPKLAGGPVSALAVHGGAIYAGGSFAALSTFPRSNLAAVNQSGTLVDAFDPGASTNVSAQWGFKTNAGMQNGGTWQFSPAPETQVRALALSHDAGRLFVGGTFTQLDGEEHLRLGAVDASNGAAVSGWKPDTSRTDSKPPWIVALDVVGNTLYAGGDFNRIGGVERSRIAALDASTGDVLGWNPNIGCGLGGEPCHVYAIEASCGGTVYAGGSFTTIGGQVRPRLAEIHPVGAAGAGGVTAWDPAMSSGTVYDLASFGPTVYAGGSFSVAGGAVRQKLAALDAGTAKAVDQWNPAADQEVRAIDLTGDGQALYAGGIFTKVGGQDRAGLAALQAVGVGEGKGDALAWNPAPAVPLTHINPGIGYPGTYALDVWGDNVFAGGEFGQLGTRAQYGYGSFTAAPDPAAVADACAPAAQGGGQPLVAPAIPEISNLRVTKRLKVLFDLSIPAHRVELDLLRIQRGYRLPVGEHLRGRGAGRKGDPRPTICKRPTRVHALVAKRYVKKQNRKRIRRLSGKRRKRFIKKKLRGLRCPFLGTVLEIDVEGAKGPNAVALTAGRSMQRGRYRVVALAMNENGDHAPAKSVDFLVGKDGRKLRRAP